MVFPEDVAALHPALQTILQAELSAGNAVVETWRGWPTSDAVCVMLQKPFVVEHAALPDGVVFRDIDDPHYWKSEYEHRPSHHLLACRF
jgi:hypothetical protein